MNKKFEILKLLKRNKFVFLIIFTLLIVIIPTVSFLLLGSSNNLIKNLLNKTTNTQVGNDEKDSLLPISLTEDQKRDIYNKVLARNATTLSTLKAPAAQSSKLHTENLSLNGNNMFDSYNINSAGGFSKYVFEYKQGKKECKYLFNTDDVYMKSKHTVMTYRDNDVLYTKTTYEDPNYGLFFVQITNVNYKTGLVQDIHYGGGEYAVRISRQTPTYDDVSNEMPTFIEDNNEAVSEENKFDESLLDKFLGEDTEIVGEKFVDGKMFYVIRYSYKMNCDQDTLYTLGSNNNNQQMLLTYSSDDNALRKIISELYIDKDTYDIYKDVLYLDSPTSDNLIREFFVSNERMQVSFNEVKEQFNFDFNVEIKDFNEPVFDENLDKQKRKNLFDSLNFSYLLPTKGKVNLIGGFVDYYETRDYQIAMDDRRFYPKGEFGDQVYKSSVLDRPEFVSPSVGYTLNVEDTKHVWNVLILNSNSVEDVIKKNYSTNKDRIKIENVSINISGTEIDAVRLRTKVTTYYFSEDGNIIEEGKDEEKLMFLFSYKNNIYGVNITDENLNDVDLTNYSLKAYDKNSKEFNEFRKYVIDNI